MKKILFYASIAMLWLGSWMSGFVNSTELAFMCESTLLVSVLLMLAYAATEKSGWGSFCLCGMSACINAAYLNPGTEIGRWLLGLGFIFLVVSLAVLYMLFRIDAPAKSLVWAALLSKASLLPLVILNTFIVRYEGMENFSTFSWILLACTSMYAVLGIAIAMKKKVLSTNAAIAAGLTQFFFVTDILSCIFVLVMIHLYKPVVPVRKKPIYEKAVFSHSRRKKKSDS